MGFSKRLPKAGKDTDIRMVVATIIWSNDFIVTITRDSETKCINNETIIWNE